MKKVLMLAVSAFLVFTPIQAFAANDGTLGTSSQGDLDITVTIQDLIQISDFSDFALGTYGGSGDLENNDDLCVYRNSAGAQYTVTATASEGAFEVQDGGESIAYSVFFNDVTGTTGEVQLSYNSASATQSGANTQSADCSVGGLSANVHVVIAEADLQAAVPGSYSGTLILTANPV
jgi:hypothetical protein